VKQTEQMALRRLIEYARLEAETQRASFTAYLLELASRSLEAPEPLRESLQLSRVQ
jgi:hypothetical protein